MFFSKSSSFDIQVSENQKNLQVQGYEVAKMEDAVGKYYFWISFKADNDLLKTAISKDPVPVKLQITNSGAENSSPVQIETILFTRESKTISKSYNLTYFGFKLMILTFVVLNSWIFGILGSIGVKLIWVVDFMLVTIKFISPILYLTSFKIPILSNLLSMEVDYLSSEVLFEDQKSNILEQNSYSLLITRWFIALGWILSLLKANQTINDSEIMSIILRYFLRLKQAFFMIFLPFLVKNNLLGLTYSVEDSTVTQIMFKIVDIVCLWIISSEILSLSITMSKLQKLSTKTVLMNI